MTDLEDLWDELPVGPAPVDEILRAAGAVRRPVTAPPTRSTRPGQRLRRSLYGVAGLGAAAATFVAGVLVARGGGGGPVVGGPGRPDQVPAAFHGALTAPADCDALLRRYVAQALPHVGADGWTVPVDRGQLQRFDGTRRSPAAGFAPSLGPAANLPLSYNADAGSLDGTVRQTDSATGTNVQEAGVDEPDVVKTDGTLLVRVHEGLLSTYDVGGSAVRMLGSLDLGAVTKPELLLSGTTVTVLDSNASGTEVESVDVSDPTTPTVTRTVDYTAPLEAARQTGSDIRLILRSPLPRLDFTRESVDANRAVVQKSTIADWLPQMRVDGKTQPAVDCQNVAIPRADLGLGTMTVVGFDASDAAATQAVALAGATEIAYQSTGQLYLAATRQPTAAPCAVDSFSRGPKTLCSFQRTGETAGDGRTYLYAFGLSGAATTYEAAGEVDGYVQDRWAMDSDHGVLRLAVSPSQQTGRFNSIVTFHRVGDQLVELGRLDGLGRDEQITSVRWFPGLALLSTYRQTDPLISVDLTDESHPRLLGELHLPGFSGYLHPLGAHRLLAFGQGPVHGGTGAKVGLFDVTDPAHVRRLAHVDYGAGTTAAATTDPRQFLWLPAHRLAVTVVRHGNVGLVSRLLLGDGSISEHRDPAEYGADVADLRVVPVAHDRVVEVTGGRVSFLDLGLT